MLRIRGCATPRNLERTPAAQRSTPTFNEPYMTLDPGNLRIVVSKCIREEFENGKTYYKLEGQLVREPSHGRLRPNRYRCSVKDQSQCRSSARGLKLRLRYKIISLKLSASGLNRDPVFLWMHREDFSKAASKSRLRHCGHRDA